MFGRVIEGALMLTMFVVGVGVWLAGAVFGLSPQVIALAPIYWLLGM